MNTNPDPELLCPLRECMETYGIGNSKFDWPNNILSTKTVVYPNGFICRSTDSPVIHLDRDEIDLCMRLSSESKAIVGDLEVGMGSESSDSFFPFFSCYNGNTRPPSNIDERVIRGRFGGVIFPPATITVEPLVEAGIWWSEVAADTEDDPAITTCWRQMIDWFSDTYEIFNPVFVRIGDRKQLWAVEGGGLPDGTEMTGSVLPRLAVGLTKKGSLVGLFGYSVQT